MTTSSAYPRYMHQPSPSSGAPPADYGPADLWPSKAPNPAYTVYRETHGNFLAGLNGETMGFNNTNADGIKDYANELDILAQADDVVGNGVFDPAGSPPTNHAGQAIFGDHVSMPGYIVRDRFYEPSEVTDLTTGYPVMYVPGGAVAIDPAQRAAYRETLLWEIPPGMGPQRMFWDAIDQSTVVPKEAAWPISGLGQESAAASPVMMFVMTGIAGAAIGLVAGLMWPKRKR